VTGASQLSEFPAVAWLPGSGGSPDRVWLEAAKHVFKGEALVAKGFALLRAGYFWEAHELLEEAWRARTPNAPERELLRAVIQIANALLKARLGKARAACRLLREATDILAALDPDEPVFGIVPVALRHLAADALFAEAEPGCAKLTALQQL
jgi:tetratricopeptide (TPR) repeat protein